jgi:hypothetical protein
MIIIDFLEDVALTNNDTSDKPIMKPVPRLYEAEGFFILPIEHKDNENNEEMNEINRNMVTRMTYSIWATVLFSGACVEMPIVEYDSEERALEVYGKLMAAVACGHRVFSFREA